MKSCRRLGWSNPRVIACLITLGIALFFGAKVQAAPQYDLKCDACHRLPPLDSASGVREPATGRVKGNHESHAGTTGATCVKCHGSELTSTGHRDKTIQVQGNINGSLGATYSRGFINQTSVPPVPLGSCSSVNCHFEALSPTWGRLPKYDLETGCGQCHKTVPDSGNRHAKHVSSGTACKQCHPDHTTEFLPFRHATSATSRGIAVQFTALPNSGGSYSGDGLNFLPSQNKTSFGNCASMYCHSNGISGAPNTTATWGGTLPADCSGCHGGNANAAYKIGTGTHAQHINNASLGTNYQCARCHNTTVSVGNDLAITTVGNHVDGVKTVAFNNGGGYNSGTCSGTLCHATGNASVPLATPPIWGGAALDCKGCHGVGSSFGEPNYGNGGAAQTTANSHSANHVTGALSCVNCHANTTSDGVSIKAGSQLHTDGTNNVGFSSDYAIGVGSYNPVAKSCASIYCHSDGNSGQPLQTPVWGDAMPAKCVGCHGGDASVTPASSVINTNKHRSHMNNYSTLGRGQNLQCGECHATTVALGDNQAISGQAKHLNKFKDYSGGNAGRYNVATYICSNLYCHSSGQAAPNNVYRNMTTSKAWNSTAKLDCNGCHGYGAGEFTAKFGEPNYLSGGGGSATANSHKKHVLDANMSSSTGCVACHRTTVDSVIANKLRDYSSAHLNKVRDISFAPLGNYTGHYTAGAGNMTCSNTYCHVGSTSAKWGAPGPLLCDSCHKASSLIPGHGKHWETATVATSYTALPGNLTGSATKYNFECSSCHNASHANGPKGLNGAAVEVLFNYTAAGRKGSYTNLGATMAYDGTLQYATNGSCTTTYCHSKGDGTEGFVTANWDAPDKSLRCNGCHGGDYSKSNPIDTNLHRNHLDPSYNSSLGIGNGRMCVECHAKTVSFANNTTIIDKTKHVNKFKDYSGVLAGGTSSYIQTSKTCSNIYCHSNGKRGTAANQFRDPAAWSVVASYGCNNCHGDAASADFLSDPTLGAPNYANSGAPGSNTSNSHKLHLQKMSIASSNACYVCHARTMDKYTPQRFRPYSTMHVSGGTNIVFGRFSSAGFKLMSSVSKAKYTAGAGNMTCSTVTCHSNGKGGYQDVKWGASTNCALCHALNKLSRGHAFHIYTSAVNNPASYNNYTANRSNSGPAPGRYNYGCANCHPVNNPNHTKGTVLIDLYPGSPNVVGLLRSKNGPSITVGAVPAGTSGSGTTVGVNTLNCANVYCHSNGYASGLVYAAIPEWYNGSFTGDPCANCHGNWPNSGIAGSPAHYNTNQVGGHSNGIHVDNIANSANFTGLATPGTSDMSSHGNAAYSTTISCNTCHWNTVRTVANGRSSQCTSACHTVAANKASATIFDKSMHVTGRVDVSFQTGLIVKSKAQLRDASFATISSSTLWHRNGTYKTAGTGSYDSSKRLLSDGSYAGGNCSNVICHFNKPVPWAGSVSCQSCHQSL